jgi:hypothetical protein
MRYHKIAVLVLLSVALLALSGCGSSNSGNAGDPLAGGQPGTGNGPGTPVAGRIMFTSAAGLAPDEQTNLLTPASKEVEPALAFSWNFMQLIPFKLTDADGNSRAGVPVKLSVYSITTLNPDDVSIDFRVPPLSGEEQQTVTTDSAGQGIFNVTVNLTTPPAGSVNVVDVVFKAVTNDATPVTAYVGNSYTLSARLPTLLITPAAADFGSATDLTFRVVGGSRPYNVSSNNTARVSATLLPDGETVAVQLVDTTQWTGSTTVSVTDAAGQSASATLTR